MSWNRVRLKFIQWGASSGWPRTLHVCCLMLSSDEMTIAKMHPTLESVQGTFLSPWWVPFFNYQNAMNLGFSYLTSRVTQCYVFWDLGIGPNKNCIEIVKSTHLVVSGYLSVGVSWWSLKSEITQRGSKRKKGASRRPQAISETDFREKRRLPDS